MPPRRHASARTARPRRQRGDGYIIPYYRTRQKSDCRFCWGPEDLSPRHDPHLGRPRSAKCVLAERKSPKTRSGAESTLRIQGRRQFRLRLTLTFSGLLPVPCNRLAKRAPIDDVSMAGSLGVPRMRDSLAGNELDAGQEQILREHVDDLPEQWSPEPIAKVPFPLRPDIPT